MNRIWCFTDWLPYEIGLERLVDHCGFVNSEEMFRAWPAADKFVPDNFPTAQLEITLEDFSVDCFSRESYIFVSQDLRDAMALGPLDVQYLPVDTSLSASLPRSKNYMLMHMPIVENVSDVDKSDYRSHRIPGATEVLILPSRIAIRQDADPKHEMFRDRFFLGNVLCTDRFAVRVLKSRCTGVRFFDLEDLGPSRRFRTLRGIEEEAWDPEQDKSCIRLVQEIG